MIGESVSRKEDLPLLTGSGRYLDDLVRPGMLYLGVVRSPHAHARIGAISTAAAASLPGVVAVASAKDLPEVSHPIPPYKSERRFRAFDQHVLAKAVVRYVGEAVAVVVAVDPGRLAEALEAVAVDYEPQPAASIDEAAG